MILLNVDSPYTTILKLHSTNLTASDNTAEKSKQVLSQLIKDLDKPTHSDLRDLTQNEANVIHLGKQLQQSSGHFQHLLPTLQNICNGHMT